MKKSKRKTEHAFLSKTAFFTNEAAEFYSSFAKSALFANEISQIKKTSKVLRKL